MASVAFFSLLTNLLLLAVPIYSLQLFDRVLSSRSMETLELLTVAVAGLLLVHGVLDLLRGLILQRVGLRIEHRLSGAIVSAAIDEAARGNVHSAHGLNDLKEIRTVLTTPSIYALFDAPWTPVFLGIIYLLHPQLGMLAITGTLILVGLALANVWASRKPQNGTAQSAIDSAREINDYLRNAEAVQAMGIAPRIAAKWERDNAEILWLQGLVGRRVAWVSAITKVSRLLMQIGIMGLGVVLTLQNELTPGGMIAASIIMARALSPVEQAVAVWKSWASAWSAYRRLDTALSRMVDTRTSVTLPEPTGLLDLSGVSYHPPGSIAPIVHGVGFRVPAGAAIGLLGPSGAGKSTLARLITGIYAPTRGEVRLDGADLAKWNRNDLGRHVGYLPQNVQLVAGTVAENIARFETARSEDILAAARMAGVHDMIVRLPDGYDTRIGEGGLMLSGGQLQRIGLARALFRLPRLIVLDEPNAHLDPEGEAALGAALETLRAERRTVVTVSHRSSILRFMDYLAIMRNGAVQEFGARDTVLEMLRDAARTAIANPGENAGTRPLAVVAEPA